MATKTPKCSICLLISALFTVVHPFMDIEELESINYGISILKEPIVIPETYPDSAILVTNRHGQQYQCNYPTHQEQKQQKEEEEKIALETGVVELLRPIARDPCLLKTKDWWTYEVCYGKHVRQYHLEDGLISGNIMYLGHYHSDFDWNNETLRDARVRSKIASGRYHSQYYTNGSKCDLTERGRETEVRYLCEETEDDYIARVDEPETCVYVITIYSPRICKHPHLKSPTPTQPIPIVCVPLLTNQQYHQYQMVTEAMRKKEEAKAKIEEEKKEKEQALLETQKEDENIEDGLADSANAILKKSLGKELKDMGDAADKTVSDTDTDTQGDLPTGWTELKGLNDLDKLLDPQGILSNMDMSKKGQNPESEETVSDVEAVTETINIDDKIEEVVSQLERQTQQIAEKSVEDEVDEGIKAAVDNELDAFEQEVSLLRKKQAMTQQRLKQIKERVKKAVTSQFQDIIEEAEEELGSEVNEALALSQLANSLNALLEKLENTEKEMKDMDREIENIAASQLGEKETPAGGEEEEEEEKRDTEGKELKVGVQAPPTTKQATASGVLTKEDGRWKMKVRTTTEEEVSKDPAIRPLPSKHQKQLESSFKDQLEKAGVDPNSVRVHVKIIGAGTSKDDDDDTTLHVLSDEETSTFQNMIVAILGGSNEAVKEQKRHSTLEDSYNFVFDQEIAQDTAESSTAPTHSDNTDDDDDDVSSDSVSTFPEKGL